MDEQEIERIADKVIEIERRSSAPTPVTPEDEAMREWTIIGTRSTLQALEELGYVLVKTKVGVFYELGGESK